MKTNTKIVLKMTHILSWIIFIGLCMQTGAILISYVVSLFINSSSSENLHLGLNLSKLYSNNKTYYSTLVLLIIFLSALKAYMFYFFIKIFLKINLTNPFSTEIYSFIANISNVALIIGIMAFIGEKYFDWLLHKNINFSTLNIEQYVGGKSEFLFMAVIIFIISQLFKRGIEIQSENELTI